MLLRARENSDWFNYWSLSGRALEVVSELSLSIVQLVHAMCPVLYDVNDIYVMHALVTRRISASHWITDSARDWQLALYVRHASGMQFFFLVKIATFCYALKIASLKQLWKNSLRMLK